MRRVAAGLAALGLIGGVGAVTYDDKGTATVTISAHGKKRTVTLPMDTSGKKYKCPDDIMKKVSPYVILGGRIELTLQDVRKEERSIARRYRTTAPRRVLRRARELVARDHRLAARFNRVVAKHNAIVAANCST